MRAQLDCEGLEVDRVSQRERKKKTLSLGPAQLVAQEAAFFGIGTGRQSSNSSSYNNNTTQHERCKE